MRYRAALVGTLWSLLIGGSSLAPSQDLAINTTVDGKADSGYWIKWDSSSHRVFMYRDISSADLPTARVFDPNGGSAAIYLLRDFRDARFAIVSGGAVTPQSGIVLTVTLGFGQYPDPKDSSIPYPPLHSLLLTYDSEGALKKAWNVEPYAFVALAVDLENNVFALGTRDAGPEGFPMLIKYSSEGSVAGEYMSSTLFAKGAKALAPDALNGGPTLNIRNHRLAVWLPLDREVYVYSLTGDLQRKVGLGEQLDRLARQNGFAGATVANLSLEDSGDITVQARFWRTLTSHHGIVLAMATVPADGSPATLVEALTSAPGIAQQFLGLSEDGRHVFLELPGKDQAFVRKH